MFCIFFNQKGTVNETEPVEHQTGDYCVKGVMEGGGNCGQRRSWGG